MGELFFAKQTRCNHCDMKPSQRSYICIKCKEKFKQPSYYKCRICTKTVYLKKAQFYKYTRNLRKYTCSNCRKRLKKHNCQRYSARKCRECHYALSHGGFKTITNSKPELYYLNNAVACYKGDNCDEEIKNQSPYYSHKSIQQSRNHACNVGLSKAETSQSEISSDERSVQNCCRELQSRETVICTTDTDDASLRMHILSQKKKSEINSLREQGNTLNGKRASVKFLLCGKLEGQGKAKFKTAGNTSTSINTELNENLHVPLYTSKITELQMIDLPKQSDYDEINNILSWSLQQDSKTLKYTNGLFQPEEGFSDNRHLNNKQAIKSNIPSYTSIGKYSGKSTFSTPDYVKIDTADDRKQINNFFTNQKDLIENEILQDTERIGYNLTDATINEFAEYMYLSNIDGTPVDVASKPLTEIDAVLSSEQNISYLYELLSSFEMTNNDVRTQFNHYTTNLVDSCNDFAAEDLGKISEDTVREIECIQRPFLIGDCPEDFVDVNAVKHIKREAVNETEISVRMSPQEPRKKHETEIAMEDNEKSKHMCTNVGGNTQTFIKPNSKVLEYNCTDIKQNNTESILHFYKISGMQDEQECVCGEIDLDKTIQKETQRGRKWGHQLDPNRISKVESEIKFKKKRRRKEQSFTPERNGFVFVSKPLSDSFSTMDDSSSYNHDISDEEKCNFNSDDETTYGSLVGYLAACNIAADDYKVDTYSSDPNKMENGGHGFLSEPDSTTDDKQFNLNKETDTDTTSPITYSCTSFHSDDQLECNISPKKKCMSNKYQAAKIQSQTDMDCLRQKHFPFTSKCQVKRCSISHVPSKTNCSDFNKVTMHRRSYVAQKTYKKKTHTSKADIAEINTQVNGPHISRHKTRIAKFGLRNNSANAKQSNSTLEDEKLGRRDLIGVGKLSVSRYSTRSARLKLLKTNVNAKQSGTDSKEQFTITKQFKSNEDKAVEKSKLEIFIQTFDENQNAKRNSGTGKKKSDIIMRKKEDNDEEKLHYTNIYMPYKKPSNSGYKKLSISRKSKHNEINESSDLLLNQLENVRSEKKLERSIQGNKYESSSKKDRITRKKKTVEKEMKTATQYIITHVGEFYLKLSRRNVDNQKRKTIKKSNHIKIKQNMKKYRSR